MAAPEKKKRSRGSQGNIDGADCISEGVKTFKYVKDCIQMNILKSKSGAPFFGRT